jgi:hypothetical protein
MHVSFHANRRINPYPIGLTKKQQPRRPLTVGGTTRSHVSVGSSSSVTTPRCRRSVCVRKRKEQPTRRNLAARSAAIGGADLTNTYAKGSYRQRISHFTEELSFLSESDKDWVMGRAIVQRLKWT